MNSIFVLLEYLRKVSKEPVVLQGSNGNFIEELETPEKVIINPNLFHKDNCIMCGRCCSSNFNTVYTVSGVDRIKNCPVENFSNVELYGEYPIPIQNRDKLLDSLIKHTFILNGNEVEIYESPCLKGKDANNLIIEAKPDCGPRCRWMINDIPHKFRCGIHPVRSVTCGLPHCRFNYNTRTRTTNIGISQYGRNWKLGCPIDLKTGEISISSAKDKIYWLKILLNCANDLKLKTWLPEIIDYCEKMESKNMKFQKEN